MGFGLKLSSQAVVMLQKMHPPLRVSVEFRPCQLIHNPSMRQRHISERSLSIKESVLGCLCCTFKTAATAKLDIKDLGGAALRLRYLASSANSEEASISVS